MLRSELVWPRWPRILVTLAFLAVGLLWMISIPYDHAPDEYSHFHFSTEFIADHLRLPIFGVDDQEIILRGVGSYNALPLFCYTVAAAVGAFLRAIFGAPLLFGARLTSLLWGTAFVNVLLTLNRRLGLTPLTGTLFTLGFGFIPQIVFVSSYVNQDVHSLAIAAILALSLLGLIQRPGRAANVFFGIAIGLLFVSKYNFFILGFWVALLFAFYRQLVPGGTRKDALRTIGYATAGFLVIASFWYVRNYVLYGEFLGLKIFLGACQHMVLPPEGGIAAIAWLHAQEFYSISFMSMTAGFDYNKLFLPHDAYRMAKLSTYATAGILVYVAAFSQDRRVRWLLAATGVFCVITLAQMTWSAITVDMQPQGRYLFPIFVPSAMTCAVLLRGRPKLALATGALVGGTTIGILIWSTHLILSTYGLATTFR